MQQNLLNAEFESEAYRNAGDKNMHVFGVMKAPTKVLHKSFCCTYACRQLHFLGYFHAMALKLLVTHIIIKKGSIESLNGK